MFVACCLLCVWSVVCCVLLDVCCVLFVVRRDLQVAVSVACCWLLVSVVRCVSCVGCCLLLRVASWLLLADCTLLSGDRCLLAVVVVMCCCCVLLDAWHLLFGVCCFVVC